MGKNYKLADMQTNRTGIGLHGFHVEIGDFQTTRTSILTFVHLVIRFAKKFSGSNTSIARFASPVRMRDLPIKNAVAFGFGNPIKPLGFQFQAKRFAEKPPIHAYMLTRTSLVGIIPHRHCRKKATDNPTRFCELNRQTAMGLET